jgi:lysophospholipase L1-like esterase
MRVPPALLATVVPYARFFHDIVHPNAAGNRVIFEGLRDFLQRRWRPYGLGAVSAP